MAMARSAVLMIAIVAIASSHPYGQSQDATQVLAAVRQALGGEKNLAAVKTFVATGRTRQVRGSNLVPIEFEIVAELPDRFVRTDEIPAQDTDRTISGFNGDSLIQVPPPPPPPPGRAGAPALPAGAGAASTGGRSGTPPNPVQARMVTLKQDFARLMLGVLATSLPGYPLDFKYAAEGEAPEGKADILDVTGAPNFSARLVVQRETHLPVMLLWQLPANNVIVRVPGQPPAASLPPGALMVDAPAPPAAGAPQEERDQYAATVAALRRQALAQAPAVEYRMYYADYRDVNGVKWPFRIRRAVAGETIEETTFDRVRVNVKIDPRKFVTSK